MIETTTLARAQALSNERPPMPRWTRPPLPRGPSPLGRLVARARAALRPRAQVRKECGC